jgi:chorismate dehydratase
MIDRTRAPARDGDGSRPRIGAVSYLNSKPLIEGLTELAPSASLILDVPSRLADSLADGTLDAGLIPSIEAFGDANYEIVSDACVATRGPVRSVKLFFRVPPGEVRTLALDEGSRTSVVLSRIMLAERYGVFPNLRTLSLDQQVSGVESDAILLIGDRAMRPPSESFVTTWDLGQEWLDWTGLPFVFAMWVARRDALPGPISSLLAAARDLGVSRLDEIARREAPALGISNDDALSYLRDNLHFRLGPAEQSGLRLFHELALRMGLAPPHSKLRLREAGRQPFARKQSSREAAQTVEAGLH